MGLNSQRAAVVVIVCLVLAGCSGDDTQSSPTVPTTDGQSITTQPTDAQSTATNSVEPTTSTSPTESGLETPTETEKRTETPSIPPATETRTETSSVETATETPTETENSVPSPIDGGVARPAVVTRVVDGDTVEVRFRNGEMDTIRLIGVDTPETSLSNQDPSEYGIPDTPSGNDWLLMWGENAESFANDELSGTDVLVVTDPESDTRGYYGRLLAYIYSDGENFGHALLERGYARVYTDGEFTLEEGYAQIEANAQDAKRGLWAYEGDTTPTQTETATPTPIPAITPTPSPTEIPSEVVTPPLPPDGDYDCGDFDTHEQAQKVFNDHTEDIYRLDADDDGQACESLP